MPSISNRCLSTSTGWLASLFVAGFICLPLPNALANELDDARALMRSGQYDEASDLAKAQVDKRVWNEAWPRLLIEGYLIRGEYEQAREVFESVVDRFGDSVRLKLLGRSVYRLNNDFEKGQQQVDAIESMLQRSPWRYSNRSDLIPLGEFFLLKGEDPKQVLKICYDQAIKLDPKNVEAHVATARMALEKNDAQVAAQALDRALKLDPDDPEILYMAARAWSGTERGSEANYLQQSLEKNGAFVPSLLLAAELQMDRERYAKAGEILDSIADINPKHPKLWALRAAIAHLVGDYEQEGTARRKALEPWQLNPEVDHTIGKQLSLHYRFLEGSEYQRRALTMDGDFGAARAQLAQDLLRLGETEEGWGLVDGIRKTDPYDVSIFNLKQLQNKLAQFATLEVPGFVIRMDAVEAKVYGPEVIETLTQARNVLVTKYETELVEPIFVEIFPRQQEFAIRTFGLPGGEGFLGVCFGRLITANSPAALNVESNWKSVLWHEYCHVVTLQKTQNKMPRWLSEGISVFEERERDGTWGERLDPTYRAMLLSDDLVPISRLSGSFLEPKSPLHLQFAYYTSSLAVEFWIERWGMKGLRKLLDDLSIGMRPEEALARLPGSLELLDAEFLEFARNKALAMSTAADFTPLSETDAANLENWFVEHPTSYPGLRAQLKRQLADEQWKQALETAQTLETLWPDDPSEEGIHAVLAKIHRELDSSDSERSSLIRLSELAAAPREGLLRLVAIDREREDWQSVLRWTNRLQGISPMNTELQTARSQAAEKMEDFDLAARALSALAAMDPIDPAMVQFRLAKAWLGLEEPARAKRACLMALEESPRFRDALELLLQLQDQ